MSAGLGSYWAHQPHFVFFHLLHIPFGLSTCRIHLTPPTSSSVSFLHVTLTHLFSGTGCLSYSLSSNYIFILFFFISRQTGAMWMIILQYERVAEDEKKNEGEHIQTGLQVAVCLHILLSLSDAPDEY